VIQKFLEKNDFDLMLRSHQPVKLGYEFPFNPEQSVLTVFSALNYCNPVGNQGAMLQVDIELRCAFVIVEN